MAAPQAIQQGSAFPLNQSDALVKAFSGPLATNWQREVPLTGTSVTVGQNTETLLVNPAGTIAALTVVLPRPYADGHKFHVVFTQVVTALTFTGGTVLPATTAATANQAYALMFDQAAASGVGAWRVTT